MEARGAAADGSKSCAMSRATHATALTRAPAGWNCCLDSSLCLSSRYSPML